MPRKKPKISKNRKIIAVILLFLTLLVVFDLITNIFNLPINALNPQSTLKIGMTDTQFYIEYPQNAVEVYVLPNGTQATDVMFTMQVTVVYNSTLIIGDPVYIDTIGAIFPKGQQIISQVCLGYQDSSHYSPGIIDVVTQFVVNLTKLNQYAMPFFYEPNVNNLTGYYPPIMWTSEGNYYPYVQIIYKNGTVINYPVNTGNLYVNGLSTIQQQVNTLQQADSNRRTNWIIVDIFLIPVMLGITAFILKVKIKDYI